MSLALILFILLAAAGVAFIVFGGRRKLPPPEQPEALPEGKGAASQKGDETEAKAPSPPAAVPSETRPESPRGAEPKDESPRATARASVEVVKTPSVVPPEAQGVPAKPAQVQEAVQDAAVAARPSASPQAAPVAEAQPVRVAEAVQPAPTSTPAPAVDAVRGKRDVASRKKGLAQTRGGWMQRLFAVFSGRSEIDPALLETIEETLLTGDVGAPTAKRMVENLKSRLDRHEVSDPDRVWDALRQDSKAILDVSAKPFGVHEAGSPLVILMVGVNGAGKTTTIAKLATRYKDQGSTVLLAAADTFRAAAVTQLEMWGRRVGVPVYKGKDGARPGAVVYEAVAQAVSQKIEVVIADTAGRLQTKLPLMEELRKIRDASAKACPGSPHEILLVLDATTGQNAISQAREFRDTLDLTGIVLTKLDGTAKGGVILAVADEFKLPVRFIGVGEKSDDLREFDAEDFVEALFSRSVEDAAA